MKNTNIQAIRGDTIEIPIVSALNDLATYRCQLRETPQSVEFLALSIEGTKIIVSSAQSETLTENTYMVELEENLGGKVSTVQRTTLFIKNDVTRTYGTEAPAWTTDQSVEVSELIAANLRIRKSDNSLIDVSTIALETIEATELANQAADRVDTSIQNAVTATATANTSALNADQKAVLADQKAALADTAASNANVKATLADQKATLADQKATLAGTEAQNAAIKALEAVAATELANTATAVLDATVLASELATNNAVQAKLNADIATGLANTAATAANTATGLANTATGLANTATTNANTATSAANLATENANTKATLADQKATLADQKAALADAAAANANAKTGETIIATENANAATAMVNEAITSSIMITLLWYGVEFDTAVSSPVLTRIGNLDLHRQLPVQQQMKGALISDLGVITKYLDPTTWAAEVLDGSSGQVCVYKPKIYWRFESDGTIRRVKVSEFALPGFYEAPAAWVGAYEASVNRTNNKLSSVKNMSVDYRGGNNNAAYDAASNTFLGRPATVISRTNFRTYARNRGANWNIIPYNVYKELTWLYLIEYANLNSQLPINAALAVNGYRQGGLGNGVTDLDGTKWGAFNGSYPFVPCGHTDSLGNRSGEIDYAMPIEYDAVIKTTKVNRYRGIENPFGHIWKWVDGVNVKIQSVASGDLSQLFVCTNPANFQDANYINYDLRGNLARGNGYTKEMLMGNFGDIMPALVGAGSTTWWSDYFYTTIPADGESLRGVLFGGDAYDGAFAGFGFSYAINAPSHTFTSVGSRLCFLGA